MLTEQMEHQVLQEQVDLAVLTERMVLLDHQVQAEVQDLQVLTEQMEHQDLQVLVDSKEMTGQIRVDGIIGKVHLEIQGILTQM